MPTEVPVLVIDDRDENATVLAYLGTKHIVGASPWDSYAKAKWMARMRDETSLTLVQIREMIGDVGGLVERMLEGYYVIEQTQKVGYFKQAKATSKEGEATQTFHFHGSIQLLDIAELGSFWALQKGHKLFQIRLR